MTVIGVAAESRHTATGNRILDALPKEDFDRLRAHLEPVVFKLKDVLYRPGDEIGAIYFPVEGVLSVVMMLPDGATVEVGTAGNEGMIGLSALLGDCISLHEIVVQGAGNGLRLAARLARQEFDRAGAFHNLVMKLSQYVVAEISQKAACNARHDLQARLARWLLSMRDRMGSDRFPLSQEFVATLLGVQRTAVTAVAVGLRRKGLIQYRHGVIEISNRAGLEAAACECYGLMKAMRHRFIDP